MQLGSLTISREESNHMFYRRISREEVKEVLKRMMNGKAVEPDGIPNEVWRCLGEDGISWLTKLFNVVLKSKKMPDVWRKSILIPIYKTKKIFRIVRTTAGLN